MALSLYITILIIETLYYSFFLKYSKNDGHMLRYITMFSIITLIGIAINTDTFQSYFLLIVMIMFGLKYYVKVNTTLFDMLVIFVMLLIKIIIELPIYILCYNTFGIFVTGVIYGIFKMLFILIFKNNLNKIYNKLQKLWNNNNFYIRYIFSTLMFLYVITSCVFIIFYYA